MKSRIATILTMVLLVAGAGGAVAVGESGSHGGPQGGAASGEYHRGHNCGKHHNEKCPPPKKHHHKKHHKAAKKHKTQKSKGNKGNGKPQNCTIKTQNGLTILYCH